MHFTVNGSELDYTFMDFCDWAACNRRNKTVLQLLMEYLLDRTLSCVNGASKALKNDGSGFLLLQDGRKVAVRVGSYVESNCPEHPDWISFDISMEFLPDLFIFCVNRSMSVYSIPTNLDVWDFYVIQGKSVADARTSGSITLPALQLLQPIPCDFSNIKQAIQSV